MHPVEHRGNDGMPHAGLPLEVEDAHHDLAFGVVASGCQSSGVREHGGASDTNA